jgi:hypothetical protein
MTRRTIPEVLEAVHVGKLSLRLADELLYFPRARQRAKLQRRLKAVEDREPDQSAGTAEIREYLDTHSKSLGWRASCPSRFLAVNHPRDIELIAQHAEADGPKCLLKRHVQSFLFRQGFEDTKTLFMELERCFALAVEQKIRI